jgi:hypothetical protein
MFMNNALMTFAAKLGIDGKELAKAVRPRWLMMGRKVRRGGMHPFRAGVPQGDWGKRKGASLQVGLPVQTKSRIADYLALFSN